MTEDGVVLSFYLVLLILVITSFLLLEKKQWFIIMIVVFMSISGLFWFSANTCSPDCSYSELGTSEGYAAVLFSIVFALITFVVSLSIVFYKLVNLLLKKLKG